MVFTNSITIHGLTKRFGTNTVVDRLNLEISKGTIFGLLGPNGAGKSTTVKMMTGILRPDSGDALIEGTSVRQDSLAVKRMIGVVPENLALFEHLTVWEHLDLVRSVFDMKLDEFRTRSQQLLSILDLSDFTGQLAETLSSGTRKKTSLAMALLTNPRVLILDEPFEGLDPVISARLKSILRSGASRGMTVFLTTHLLESVDRFLTDYGILRAGALKVQGTIADLASRGLTLQQAYLKEFEPVSSGDLPWLG